MRLALARLAVLGALALCGGAHAGDGDAVKTPRAAEESLAGVRFSDGASFDATLGAAPCRAMPEADPLACGYRSADGTQAWIVVFHPGGGRHEAAEMIVRAAGKADRDSPQLPQIAAFTSGKGIRLGLRRVDVQAALGPPSKRSAGELEYRFDYNAPGWQPWLDRYALPEYFARYTFERDRLVAFHFGFTYP